MSSVAARLELLCEVNRRLASFTDLDELLAYATSRARDLFEAEGCALLFVDRESGDFRFPVSSQSAASSASPGRLAEVRFPITQGVAGWVHANGQAVVIEDTQHDPRFYPGVDKTTGTTTRSLLAATLRTCDGAIGVIEVINPRAIGDGDLAFLEALGSDVAVAHERATFSAALQAEATGLRRLARLSGMTLVALGVGLIGAAVVAHAARALPISELAGEPGIYLGGVLALIGIGLAVEVRRVPSAA